MALDNTQKTDFLFNQFLNQTTTRPGLDYFNQVDIPYQNYIPQEDVWIQDIPANPDFSSNDIPPEYDISRTEGVERYVEDYQLDLNSGYVERFIKLKLKCINKNNAPLTYSALDPSGGSLLADAIQYNYKNNQSESFNPYNYILYYKSGGTDVAIQRSSKAYGYLFDIKSGYITFYGSALPANIQNGNAVLYLTFCRYIGVKGMKGINDVLNTKLDNYLTHNPPAFEDNSGNSRYDRAAFELYWRKGAAYDVSYHLSTTGEELPHITSIHIDLSGDDWIPIAELSGNATNHTIHLGDSYNIDGVDLSFNDEGLYHFRVYGVNHSQDPSINTLDYLDISFQNVETFPDNAPTLGFQRAFDVSNEKYININGIPNILSVDVLNGQFTISDVSDGFLLRNREKTECAEFIGDTKYDISNQLFKISDLNGNELTFDVSNIQFRNSLFIQGDLSLGSLDAFNIRGVSSSIVDVSRARWWLDASSLVFDDEPSFPELTQSIFDISLEEIDHDDGDKTYKVSRNPFDHSRNIVDDISSSSLFFAEARFVGVYYHSSLIGGETYYRDWSDVSGPDYSGLSGEGIQDVIRENREKTGEQYKWIGKRFDISISTIDQTYRVLNINGETTSQKWRDMGLRVYILQHLYDNVEGTGEPFSMTTWMDATRSLSSRVSSSPFIESHRDGYGCYVGDGRISLKLNTKKGMNHVYVLVGISNEAGAGDDTRQPYIEQILLE